LYPSSGLKLPPAADFGKRVGKQLTDAVGTPDVWTQQHVFNQAILHCAIGYWVKEQSSETLMIPNLNQKRRRLQKQKKLLPSIMKPLMTSLQEWWLQRALAVEKFDTLVKDS
jgi:hypothetical protein